MADEVIQDDHPEIRPATVPKPEREPVTIEGEAVGLSPESADLPAEETPASTEFEPVSPAAATEPPETEPDLDGMRTPPPRPPYEDPPFVRPFAPKPSNAAAFMAGGAGALVGAAIVITVMYFFDSGGANLGPLQGKLGALDSAVSSEAAERKSLNDRLAALEAKSTQAAAAPEIASLAARLASLEGSAVKPDAIAAVDAQSKAAQASADKAAAMVASLGDSSGAKPAGANPEVVKLIGDQQTLADRLAKMETELAAAPSAAPSAAPDGGAEVGKLTADQQALANRVASLETGLAAAKAAPAVPDPAIGKLAEDEKGLVERLGKLEAALAAPKTETRADPSVTSKGDPIAQSVVAVALERRLYDGQPYATELSALEKVGADPKALAALEPYAKAGAPTTATLAAGFAKLAPALRTHAKTAAHGDYAESLWDEMKGLVKVHPVGETQGDDPAAVTTQVTAALGRGDLAAARSAFAKLPEDARASAAAWSKDLEGVAEARASAQSLIETSLGRIAEQKN